MRSKLICAVALCGAFSLNSCAPALPVNQPQEGVTIPYAAAREAAQEAKEAADRCRIEAEKSQSYFEEAQAMLQRAEEIQKRVEEQRKREEEKKKRIVIRRPKRPAPVETRTEASSQSASSKAGAPDKPPLKEEPKYPEHSPSDHP